MFPPSWFISCLVIASLVIVLSPQIAGTPTADGESRIKAVVMIAYLAGRPAPTGEDNSALRGFRALQLEFGIQLTGEGMQLTGEGS